jgi:hypothetical protein
MQKVPLIILCLEIVALSVPYITAFNAKFSLFSAIVQCTDALSATTHRMNS